MSTRSEITVPFEDLLADRAWLRSLARSLVVDENAAADLEQEAWTAALERPPRRRGSPRAWLATVLRNRARDAYRRQRRRRQREVRAARPEALTPTSDLAEQADTQRRVIAAVLALAEPYRSTVLWRYFEDVDSTRIAERMNVSASTVRTRLARAHEQLRATLREAHGNDDASWRAALLPLAMGGTPQGGPGTVESVGSSVSGVSGPILIYALIPLAVVAVLLVWRPWAAGDATSRHREVGPGVAADAGPSAQAPAKLEGVGMRAQVPASGGAPTAAKNAAAGGHELGNGAASEAESKPPARGHRSVLAVRVLDASERPVADADVVLLDSSLGKYPGPRTLVKRARTDTAGTVRFDDLVPKGNLQVRAAAGSLSAISRVYDGSDLPSEPVELQLEASVVVSGHVVDADAHGVSGAIVALYAELPGSVEVIAARRTDDRGAFRMEGIPASLLAGRETSTASLEVRAASYAEVWQPLAPDLESTTGITIALRKSRVVRGRVVDPAGRPVSGASLEFPDSNGGTETDAEGRFKAGGLPPRAITILFRSPEFAPVRVKVPFDGELVTDHEDVVMRPGKPIAGQVVDADGAPLKGVHVAIQSHLLDQFVRQGGTDEAGRFRFEHLGDGDHTIVVFTSAGGEASLEGIRAGELQARVVMRAGPHLLLSFWDAAGEKESAVDAVSFHASLADDPDTTVGASHGGEDMRSLRLQLPREGRWNLTVRVSGYKPFEQEGIDVAHDQGTKVKVRLIPLGKR